MAEQRSESIDGIVNLDRYPLDKPNSKRYAMLLTDARRSLDSDQYCVFPEFLTESAIQQAIRDVNALIGKGYRNVSQRNCYLERTKDERLAADHPKNLFFNAAYDMLAADILPVHFALKHVYYWPAMIDFVAAVTRSDRLYVSEDPYQPVNVLCAGDGDASAWHFDSWNAFTMTLLLQAPDSGGNFELAPCIRSRDDPNYHGVGKVLCGARDRVVSLDRAPGELVIFRGSTALHRVTTVRGATKRLMGVFVYESEPGVIGDPHVNATVYGPRTLRH